MKRFTPISPIIYIETYENNPIKHGDAISNKRELVLITEPNMNVGIPQIANRTSEKLKCSSVRKDRLFV